jgi:RND family efflux transporter MFP subunit
MSPRLKLSRKNRLFLSITALSTLSAGALMATAPRHDPSVVEEKAWPVSTVPAEAGTRVPELNLFGRVETPNHASLSAAVEAEVQTLHVREGDHVAAGQLLLSLDDAEERLRLEQRAADLQQAEAGLASLRRDMDTERAVLVHMRELNQLTRSKAERLRKLNSRNLIATEQLENTLQEVARQGIELSRQQALVDKHPHRLAMAEAGVSRARAQWRDQQIMLERTAITAPFDGRVSALAVSPGDRVRPGEVLISLYDTGALQVRVPIPSGSAGLLKQALARGETITAVLGDSGIPAQLQQLAGEVRSGSSGIDGIFRVMDDSGALELGRAVDVSIALPPVDNAIALPLHSLYGNRRIYLVEGQRLVGREVVALGQRLSAGGELQVLVSADGLDPGTEILSTNLPRATTGLRVQVLNSAVADSGGKDTGSSHPG